MDSGYLKAKIEYANQKIEESCRNGENMDIRYWVGYKDGLLAVLRHEDTNAAPRVEVTIREAI